MKNFLWLMGLALCMAACGPVLVAAPEPVVPEPIIVAMETSSDESLDPIPTLPPLVATSLPLLASSTPSATEIPFDIVRHSPIPQSLDEDRRTRSITPTPTRVVPKAREVRVPILMYHHIAVPPDNADAIRRDLSVWPERFEAQMAYFASRGYQSVKLADVYEAVMNGKPLPNRPIVFTFDDGYDDHYSNALPILQRHNFSGTFYIATGLLAREGYMNWEQIAALGKAGMDVESHSVTHPPLKQKPVDFLRREIVESKRALERVLGRPVLFFCYPSGVYDALTIQVLQESGYLSATTTHPGARESAAAPYEWPRVRVRGADKLGDLIKRLSEMEVR